MKYTTKNGIQMLKCYPLNWRIEKKYYDGTMEINPDFYVIENLRSLHTIKFKRQWLQS